MSFFRMIHEARREAQREEWLRGRKPTPEEEAEARDEAGRLLAERFTVPGRRPE